MSAAQALFEKASRELDQGHFDVACPMIEEVLRKEPAANGARMALAECYEGQGRLASAHRTYLAAAEAADSLSQTARARLARDRAQGLASRVGGVIVQVAPGASVPGIAVTLDGQPLDGAAWNKPAPLDEGAHALSATAPGKKAWTRSFTVKNGANVAITIDGLETEGPSTATVAGATSAAPTPANSAGTTAPQSGRDTPPLPPQTPPDLSHRGQVGAFVRLDIDALSGGAVAAPGLSWAPHARFEISASALLGKRAGFEPGAALFFLVGSWKPFVSFSVPVLFQTEPYAGLRGAAGMQWDVNRHFGVQASFGGAYFPDVPAGYAHAALLPALGVQGRL